MVQAAGPYRLAGSSMGGVIAYEMAQQLRADGDEVALLGLVDAWLLDDSIPEVGSEEAELANPAATQVRDFSFGRSETASWSARRLRRPSRP